MSRGRLRKISKHTLRTIGALLALAVIIVVTGILSLDTAFVRARVRALTHLPIDWQHTELSLGRGVVLRGLSFSNPPPFDAVAPELIHIDTVEVSWALGKLLGSGPLAERIRVKGVRATIVVDEHGRSSLTALAGPDPAEPNTAPSPPLSRLLESLGARLPLEHATITDARIRFIRLETQGRESAELAAELELDLPKPNVAAAKLQLSLIRQDLIDELPPIRDVLSLEARASFEPSNKRIILDVPSLRGFDGALSGSARVELLDDGGVRVESAAVALDSAPIQATLSHAKSPLRLRGKLSVAAKRVLVGKFPTVEHGGSIDVDAKLESLLFDLPHVHAEGEKLSAEITLRAAQKDVPDEPLGAAKLELKLGALRLVAGHFSLGLEGVALSTTIDGLDPYAKDAMAMANRVRMTGRLGRLRVQPGGLTVIGEDVRLTSDLTLPAAEPGALALDVPIVALAVSLSNKPILGSIDADHRLVRGEPARLHIALERVRLALDDLLSSEGHEHSELSFGPITLKSKLDKDKADAVAFDLDVAARNLGPLASLITLPPGASVPWSEITAHAHTQGRIQGLRHTASIVIDEKSELELSGFRLRGTSLPMAAQTLALKLRTRGGLRREEGELHIRTGALSVAKEELGSPNIDLALAFDLDRSNAKLSLDSTGGKLPAVGLRGAVSFDRGTRALHTELTAKLEHLALVAQLLPRTLTSQHQVDWEHLTIELSEMSDLRGVVSSMPELRPQLVAHPIESARGAATLTLGLSHADYRDRVNERAVALDGMKLTVGLGTKEGDRDDPRTLRTANLVLALRRATVELPGHRLELHDFAPTLQLSTRGTTASPELTAKLDLTLGALTQDYYPPYPLGKLSLGATVQGNAQGLVRVERLELDNQLGGTKLSLKGGVDLRTRRTASAADELLTEVDPNSSQPGAKLPFTTRLPGRVGLDVELTLTQRLAAFSLIEGLKVEGVLTMPLRVQSGDLSLFSLRGTLGLDKLSARWPSNKLELDGMRGKVPLVAELIYEAPKRSDSTSKPALRLVPHPNPVSFPRPRFAEHQPFLAERSFFAIDRLKLGTLEVGPLAGNLALDHTRIELAQLEMHAAGGRVRGQLLADLAGDAPRLAFRGDVTGLSPKTSKRADDKLDANVALLIDPLHLMVEGRAELLHISKPLLLDLIDLWDPYHADVSANRARLALKFGYPEQVRLAFEQGFASLKLQLGGLTRAIRIDEIKGVPIGPLLERYVGKTLRPLIGRADAGGKDTAP